MGVRAPQGDDDEEPETIAFGIAAVDGRLGDADLAFPAEAADVIEAIGGAEVPYDAKGRSMALAEAIEECDRQSFATRQELLNALHPVFEQRRGEPAGVVDRMRSLLPF